MSEAKDNIYRRDLALAERVARRYGYILRASVHQRTPMPVAMLAALGYLDAANALFYEKGYPGGGHARNGRH